MLAAGAVLQVRTGDQHEAARLLAAARKRNPALSKRVIVESFHLPCWPRLVRGIDAEADALVELGLPRS